jgi:enoyl-CoA hydratase
MSDIDVKVVGTTLVVTFERVRARNAFTIEMARDVEAAMDRLDEDPSLRVGVLTGAGGCFCAGQDLAQGGEGIFARAEGRGWFGLIGRPPHKPVIAAVEGYALAGGFEVALACDLIVCGSDARFGVPEVRSGLVALGGSLVTLPLALPMATAAELALTGDPMSAERAHHHGLVTRLSEPGEALDDALALADRIASNPPEAVRHAVAVLRATRASVEGPGWALQARQTSTDELRRTLEFQEGTAAFLEKRPPAWAAAQTGAPNGT